MGNMDIKTKAMMRKNENFADMFNMYVFEGEKRIDPQMLREVDTTLLSGISLKGKAEQRIRDVMKHAAVKKTDHAIYLILGVENGTLIHYSMPVYIMHYDAMTYIRQIDEMRDEVRKGHPTSSEFISGMFKGKKIIPVITLFIYWGKEKWDGPLRLHDMFDEEVVKAFGEYIPDYQVHVVCVNEMTEEEIEQMNNDLRTMLEVIHSKSRKEVERILELERGKNLSDEAISLISEMTGREIRREEENRNMILDVIENEAKKAAIETKEKTMKEDVVKCYQGLKNMTPTYRDEDIFAMLSKQFDMSVKTIRKLCL